MTNSGKRLIKNASYLFVGAVISNIASFAFRIIVAREFGPEGFGVFSLALMITSIATTVSLLGLPDGMENFVSKFQEQGNSSRVVGVILTGGSISITISIVATAILILTSSFISIKVFESPRLAEFLVWFSLIVPASVVIKMASSVTMGYERGEYRATIRQIFPKSLSLIFVMVVIFYGGQLIEVGKVYVAAMWISAGIGILIVVKITPIKNFTTIETNSSQVIAFSAPLMFTATVGMFLSWVDTAVVGIYLGEAKVGSYQSAFLLGSSLSIFLGAISGSLYPHFSSLIEQDKIGILKHRFGEGRRWATMMAIAPATYLIIFPEISIVFLFGEEYRTAGIALAIIVAGQFVSEMVGPVTNLLKTLGESRYILLSYSAGAAVNALISILLVPKIGIVGAGVGTATATIIIQYSHLYKMKSYFDISIVDHRVFRSLGAAVFSVMPARYLSKYVDTHYDFFIHILVFSLIYSVLVYLFGGISTSELYNILDEDK